MINLGYSSLNSSPDTLAYSLDSFQGGTSSPDDAMKIHIPDLKKGDSIDRGKSLAPNRTFLYNISSSYCDGDCLKQDLKREGFKKYDS